MNQYVLDACALMALLQNEPGADKVASIINTAYSGKATITINTINLLEIYYDAYRSHGKEQADRMIAELEKRLIVVNHEINGKLFEEAGRFKATYKISLADSIALAQALVLDAELLTADHHEFDAVEKSEPIRFLWIR